MNYNSMQYISGLAFYPSTLILDVDRVQKRKHRKKRINKKWLKRYGYIEIEKPSKKIYVMGNKIIAHPCMIEKLNKTYRRVL